MAGDWLKLEANTPEKEEVLAITAQLGWDDADLTVGKLFRLWRWFDQQTTDGNAARVTPALLDRIIGVSGFCEAVHAVGWLQIDESGVSLPNFDRHNGQTAKNRALTAKRVAKHKSESNDKANGKGNGKSVSGALPREEKNKPPKSPPKKPAWGEPPDGVDPKAWGEWADYKRGRPHPSTITKTANFLSVYPPEVQQRVVSTSIRNEWKGLFEPKSGEACNQGDDEETRLVRRQLEEYDREQERRMKRAEH